MTAWWRIVGAGLALLTSAQSYYPPQHTAPPPPLFARATPQEVQAAADGGTQLEHDRPARWSLAEHRRLASALAGVKPGRKGVVDAYVLSVALDSDPVFGREAREAATVLARRYDAAGRTIVLAGSDGSAESSLPRGAPANIEAALARIAEVMDAKEDVLVLYTTSHGAPLGVVYNDADHGYGAISPARLWSLLGTLGIANRLLFVSACYSGVFVPLLSGDTSIVVTAASAERSSFGCVSDNDWTFFGDAMVNHGLRKPVPLAAAVKEATDLIARWEGEGRLLASEPQVSIGAGTAKWLAALEARSPKVATPPVGRPAIASLAAVPAGR
ncbi:Peptidase C13 family protein [Sphingomonas guangdongensis]|uniref:Peptidase C13 family protein n=1 Tax=Sphingomonas guangdongensis TaxID=1141890 RepID=A0A285QBM4_9SPHN|nr:C13 family peptidase [Sphingomonas guangdongensis]SOB79293.1 Peptidase C13 family protein [Sphingomonas guangdongensis]